MIKRPQNATIGVAMSIARPHALAAPTINTIDRRGPTMAVNPITTATAQTATRRTTFRSIEPSVSSPAGKRQLNFARKRRTCRRAVRALLGGGVGARHAREVLDMRAHAAAFLAHHLRGTGRARQQVLERDGAVADPRGPGPRRRAPLGLLAVHQG